METNASQPHSDSLSRVLHLIASILFLLFAVSHFGFLTIQDITHGLENQVFPFITNSSMYLLAGIVELALGFVCLKYRGRDGVNILILTFVGMICWYRFSFYYTGGVECNCLGLLGRLLNVGAVKEKLLQMFALGFFVVSTLPWFLRLLRSFEWPTYTRILLSVLSGSVGYSAQNNGAIQVVGELQAARYSPLIEGKAFAGTEVTVSFVVILSEKSWSICATNQNDPVFWAQILFDGTNVYTIAPEGANFWIGERPTNAVAVSTITPGSFYVAPADDTLGLATIYCTYALTRSQLVADKKGIVSAPLPWLLGRSSPRAYGFKWVTNYRDRFLSDFAVIKDSSLDLPDENELTRHDIDFPHALGDRNSYRQSIDYRKQIPNGFTNAVYRCTEWHETNRFSIPKASVLTHYLFGGSPKRPYKYHNYRATLQAKEISLLPDYTLTVPKPGLETAVRDYRYKVAQNRRIFNYADYKLAAGEAWKSADDPILIAQRDHYLKHGPKINRLISTRNILMWLLCGAMVAPLIILVVNNRKRRESK